MSTKTIYKRIALVAVAALGAGVLSVAPASAGANTTAITKANIHVLVPSAGTTAAVGVCAVAAAARSTDVASATSTGTTIATTGALTFETVTNGKGSLVISGPAVWAAASAGNAGTISADAKTAGFQDAGAVALKLTPTGVGAIVVTAYNAETPSAATAAVESFGITVVASCESASAPLAANSVAVIGTSDSQASSSSTDATLAYADRAYGSTLWINLLLRNAYKGDVDTAGVITATATNGALVQFDNTNNMISSTSFVLSAADSNDAVGLSVKQDTSAAPGAALSTTVTFQYNGVTVATKSLSFFGVAASIVVDPADVTVGAHSSTGAFKYIVRDNAGNQIDTPSAPTGALAGVTYAGIVSNATGTGGGSTTSAKGTGTWDCAAAAPGKSGSQSIQVGFVNAALQTIKSNAFTATCGSATIDKFTASLDKAVYAPGEIATLTIKGTDVYGGIVADTAVSGAAYDKINIPGMTKIGAAIANNDAFSGGALKYTFRVDQILGSYVGQAQVSATVDTKPATMTYKIASTTTAVTNEDVLKAIVSLIASINKQIAALQKALLRR
jgi:hypothetical protein